MKNEDIKKEIDELKVKIDTLTSLVTGLYGNQLNKQLEPIPPVTCQDYSDTGTVSGNLLLRKPIMYFYNMTGISKQFTIDFKNNKIPDSVPEVRKDNKLVFTIEADSSINGKYNYLYYEFEIDKEPKSTMFTYVRNNKDLYDYLLRLCQAIGLQGQEQIDFACYWDLELKRLDCEYFKCEVFTEDKLDKLFPIEVSPSVDYLIRRYIKFVPCDKLGKGNIDSNVLRKSRSGSFRACEWGGWISGQTKIH